MNISGHAVQETRHGGVVDAWADGEVEGVYVRVVGKEGWEEFWAEDPDSGPVTRFDGVEGFADGSEGFSVGWVGEVVEDPGEEVVG